MVTYQSPTWTLDITPNWIDTTMGIPTVDESWRGTDSNGHEHYYDADRIDYTLSYPTLDYVIDAQHWCNGDEGHGPHDPHMAVDESHYECKLCHEVVEPGMHPPGHPSGIIGSISATLTGVTSAGRSIVMTVTKDEADAIQNADAAERAEVGQRILNAAPSERILRWETSL